MPCKSILYFLGGYLTWNPVKTWNLKFRQKYIKKTSNFEKNHYKSGISDNFYV